MVKLITWIGLPLPALLMGWQLVTAQTHFVEKAAAIGIDHFHLSTDLIGGGLAVFDFNNDGWEDIWITGGNNRDVLYRNNADGTFTEVGFLSGLLITLNYHTKGIVTGDINNDGWRDVFLTTRTGSPNLLLLNNGDGTFVNIANFAGVGGDGVWSAVATMADFNNDGWLDIYVGNYVQSNAFLYDTMGNIIGYDHTCVSNYLYLNNGDLTFTNISEVSGTADAGCALALLSTDFNLDGKPDLLVGNDYGEWVAPNAAYQNESSSFTNQNTNIGMDNEMYTMGIAGGDVDQDGDQDYYITNLGRNALMENDGGHFTDIATAAGVEDTYAGNNLTVGWGTAFVDVDNATDLDLFVANGFILAQSFNQTSVQNPDKLFLNNAFPWEQKNRFTDATIEAGLGDTGFARGMVYGDFDKDGDQDLVILRASGTSDPSFVQKVLFYENELHDDNNWLDVKLEGVESNRDAFGAKIRIVADGISWVHELVSGSSHASQNTSIAHFGLGNAEKVDSLVIDWPMGARQVLTDIYPNQSLHVLEDTSEVTVNAVDDISGKTDLGAFVAPNPFTQKTTIYFATAEKKKLLLVDATGKVHGDWTTVALQFDLPTSNLQPGIYFLKIQTENNLISVLKLSIVP